MPTTETYDASTEAQRVTLMLTRAVKDVLSRPDPSRPATLHFAVYAHFKNNPQFVPRILLKIQTSPAGE